MGRCDDIRDPIRFLPANRWRHFVDRYPIATELGFEQEALDRPAEAEWLMWRRLWRGPVETQRRGRHACLPIRSSCRRRQSTASFIDRKRGGYCFEQDSLLQRVLSALGYRVEPLMVRVLWIREPDAPPPAWSHMALRVFVNGVGYLVDTGFGSRGPLWRRVAAAAAAHWRRCGSLLRQSCAPLARPDLQRRGLSLRWCRHGRPHRGCNSPSRRCRPSPSGL
ncbi:N-acetyltransferase [compost metagenome]